MNAQPREQPAATATGETASNVVRLADAARTRRPRSGYGRAGSAPLTDTEVDRLVRRFLNSPYSSDDYADWPFDRRLERFLKHGGLGNLADNGDAFAIICERVMTFVSRQRARGRGQR